MKVKIVKSELPTYWYNEKIGQEFNVFDFNIQNYKLCDDTDYIISKEDCIIVDYSQTPIKPDHYKTNITPIEFIEANNLGFHEGNVIKYITRYKDKNGIEDLEKAKTYIEMLINKLKRENV